MMSMHIVPLSVSAENEQTEHFRWIHRVLNAREVEFDLSGFLSASSLPLFSI